MRLLKLGIYSVTYLHDFYLKRPALKKQPYRAQYDALINDCFGSSDFWTAALTKLNYQTNEIIANAEFLQKSWAAENNFSFNERIGFLKLPQHRLKNFARMCCWLQIIRLLQLIFSKTSDANVLLSVSSWGGAERLIMIRPFSENGILLFRAFPKWLQIFVLKASAVIMSIMPLHPVF
jgi:hypothetical protein